MTDPLLNPTPQQHRLNTNGYVHLHGIVPTAMCNELREAAADKALDDKWKPILVKSGMDINRLMAPVPSHLSSRLFAKIEQGCRTFFPEAVPRKWVFLKSMPGGQEQPAHVDFLPIPPTQDPYDYTRLPASLLVGIEDGSYIYGFGWNRQVAMESEKAKVSVKKGDILMFRGDFIHGGGDYTELNVRIHCFLDPKGVNSVRVENQLNLVQVVPKTLPIAEHAPQTCEVFGCTLTFSSARALRKHRVKDHGFSYKKYPSTVVQPPRRRRLNKADPTS